MSNEELLDMFDIEGQDAAAAEKEAPVEEPEVEEPVEEEPEQPEDAEGTEDAEVPQEQPVEEAPVYMGKYKTPEDMEAAFREYQSHADKQLAQEQAKREAYEQMIAAEQQMMQQYAQQDAQQAAQQAVEVSPEQLGDGIKTAPVDTFHWAVNNNPALVPQIIAGVAEEHGAAAATEMQTVWTNVQLQAQQAQFQEQMQAQMEQVLGPQVLQQSMEQGLNAVESKYEDFDALRMEVAENLKQMGQLPSYDPATVAQAVEMSYLQAHRMRALKAASEGSVGRTPTPQETVESGTPGAAPIETPEDAIKAEILDAWNNEWR